MKSKLLQKLKKYNKLLIVGPYPPPLGGVSVHIYRLNKLLKNSEVFKSNESNTFKGQNYIRVLYKILTNKYDAIHIHVYDIKLIVLIISLRKIKKFDIIASSHNDRLFETNSKFKLYVFKMFLKSLNTLVVGGKHILKDYRARNVQLPKEIIIEPAFLLPPENEESKILQTYPDNLFEFIDLNNFIIVSNAFQITFHNGIELYGLDMCIELTAKLKNDFPNIGFIFALANEKNDIEYLKKMQLRIKKLNIEDKFYFLTGQKELWPLFKKAKVMIRPTTTDGDALSIREASYFGCHTVASDVSDRPEGTILFKNRDINDLYIKVKEILNECAKQS